ncbi:hypothetical protein [Virgibacillus salexigens]|uniref:hypothetical protein n=1 Tax=Virgibacillus salexigens TaxID=61016 RepID=UPI003081B589
MRKARKKSNDNSIFPTNLEDLKRQLQTKFDHNSDLNYTIYQHQNQQLAVFYVTYLIDTNKVEASLLKPLLDSNKPGIIRNFSIKFHSVLEKKLRQWMTY